MGNCLSRGQAPEDGCLAGVVDIECYERERYRSRKLGHARLRHTDVFLDGKHS
jgi:hypothetical protein